MLDLKWIRDNAKDLDAALEKRGKEPIAAQILALDETRRKTITTLQEAQARRNAASKEIGKAKASKDETTAQKLMEEVAQLKQALAEGEEQERQLDAQMNDLLAGLPNIPHADVPVGSDETGNTQVRSIGEIPKFSFTPKQHFEIGEALGLMDFETAAKISGARFVVLKGALAKMERALGAFMLDVHTNEFGYEEVLPPYLVHDQSMYGTGQLPKFYEDQFPAIMMDTKKRQEIIDAEVQKISKPEDTLRDTIEKVYDTLEKLEKEGKIFDRLWLIPTAEVSLTNLVRESILSAGDLPLRYTAHTPCFRAEAGSAGRDTRGMIRQHQFSKVELVSIVHPDKAMDEHERMTSSAEEILKRLGLAYRVMLLCTGDMGFGARKTYDLEVWLPGQNAYREISSCSVCGDFQARRMNARFRSGEGKDLQFVHTLNGSGLAVGRTMVALLENYQQEDGSVIVPEALRPYMGGLEVIGR